MFHKWVAKEMKRLKKKDYLEPEAEINPEEEHLVGVMTDELKRLFTLWEGTLKAGNDLVEKVVAEIPLAGIEGIDLEDLKKLDGELKKKVEAAEAELNLLRRRADALGAAFWLSVREEFSGLEGKSIGVRKGFKIIWSESKERERGSIGIISIIPVGIPSW